MQTSPDPIQEFQFDHHMICHSLLEILNFKYLGWSAPPFEFHPVSLDTVSGNGIIYDAHCAKMGRMVNLLATFLHILLQVFLD
jgi:hypothetical protein